MPEMAAFVANLRSAFGASIDEAVARGKAGEPTFYARENGRVVGTPSDEEHNKWSVGVTDRRYGAIPGSAYWRHLMIGA